MASPAPLALFPALLPRSPLGSRPTGPVSRTSSALAAWFYMGSCLCPYGFSWLCFPHFFRARRLDPHGLLFGSLLWFLPPHRPSFPHFFRGRRLDLGSCLDPYGFSRSTGPVSRTSSAVAARIRLLHELPASLLIISPNSARTKGVFAWVLRNCIRATIFRPSVPPYFTLDSYGVSSPTARRTCRWALRFLGLPTGSHGFLPHCALRFFR